MTALLERQTAFVDLLVNHGERAQMYLRDYGHRFNVHTGQCACGVNQADFDDIHPSHLDWSDVCSVHGYKAPQSKGSTDEGHGNAISR